MFDENLKKRFANTHNTNHDIHKFTFLLQKGVSPTWTHKYWEICNETPLPEKEDFYSHLNIANITDVDCTNSKRVCKDFQFKNLGRYHDFYVQTNTLLLVDMF